MIHHSFWKQRKQPRKPVKFVYNHVIRLNKCWNELKTSLIRKPVAGLKNRWQFWTKNFSRGLIWYAWCLWQAFLSKVIESDYDNFFWKHCNRAPRSATKTWLIFLQFLLNISILLSIENHPKIPTIQTVSGTIYV